MLVRHHNTAVGLFVTDRDGLGLGFRAQKLDFTKAAGKRDLRLGGQVLSRKNQYPEFVKSILDPLPRGRAQMG